MPPESNPTSIKRVKGWIFDVYPSTAGQMNVWFITENGKRIRLIDDSKPRFYVSTKHGTLYDLYRLVSRLPVDSCRFVSKYLEPPASLRSIVLEVTLKNYMHVAFFVRRVLRAGRYLRYQVYNCDLKPSQVYLYERDVFPFAFVDVEVEKYRLSYTLLDSVEDLDYQILP